MKEKIIDFSNGKFTYEQPKLILEPSELEMELGEGDEARGSIRVSSSDERRVKGTVLSEIPGMTLYGNSFFARAARVEFSYTPRWIRPGEQKTGRLLFLTSAGEYEIPVQIRIPQPGGSAGKRRDSLCRLFRRRSPRKLPSGRAEEEAPHGQKCESRRRPFLRLNGSWKRNGAAHALRKNR